MASGAVIADSLAKGIGLGQNARELTLKRDILLKEQAKEKIARYSTMLDNSITTLKEVIEGAPDRSDPNYKTIIDTQRDQLIQTAKIIGTIDPQVGQFFEQKIQTIHANTKDKATQATEAALAEDKAMEAKINRYAPIGGQQPQPTAGAQSPSGPAAPPPGPTMAPPTQQVAQEPTAGLTSQAAAQPPMPAMDMPAPAPVGTPPVAGPAGPQMAQAGDPRAALREKLMQRRMEAEFPKTQLETKMDEAKVKQFYEVQTMADQAEDAIRANARARQLLKEGIYTGITAKAGLIFGKATGSDPEKVKRTEEFMALLGKTIGPQLKMFGSATAISNLDLQTVEQYIGKDITLNEESIEAILSMNQAGAENSLRVYNRYAPGVGMPERRLPMTQPEGAQGNFTPDAEGWITLGPGTRMRLKPGQ